MSAGSDHTVLVRSDGQVVACGCNFDGQCNIPDLPEGIKITEASAGARHTVLLQSNGQALACSLDGDGPCNIPDLPHGVTYLGSSVHAGLLVLQLFCHDTGDGYVRLSCFSFMLPGPKKGYLTDPHISDAIWLASLPCKSWLI